MVVASISLLVQTSPMTCLLRAVAAYVVFAAFGIVIRYLLADGAGIVHPVHARLREDIPVEDIVAGTSVDDLLADEV